MTRILLLLLLAGVAGGLARGAAAATPAERAAAILAAVVPGVPESRAAAEEALVKEPDLLPAIREALAARRTAPEGAAPLEAERLQAEVEVLDRAGVRLQWRMNPPQLIQQWLAKQTFPDGHKFTREATPLRLADDRLLRAFPDQLFYLVSLPGYQGGAAPPEEVLQALAAPPPLTALNLFAVKKDRTLRLIADAGQLAAFFGEALAPAKSREAIKDDLYAWLRLHAAFRWWNNRPLAFAYPDAAVAFSEEQAGRILRAAGKAVLVPPAEEGPAAPGEAKSSGELTGSLYFRTDDGTLAHTGMSVNLNLATDPRLLIPMAPPPGGPGGAVAPEQ